VGVDEPAIRRALDRAYAAAGTVDISAGGDRVVVFSDLHKGARDGADDFQRCEPSYNAALAYYYELGWHLIELGDVEELWENRFDEVAASYPRTLELAARFHSAGRYTRFWGNHDLVWKDPELFGKLMSAHGYEGVAPIEALRMIVWDSDERPVGELFLVHGHQGSADSERYAWLSSFLVHRGWRPLQRLLNRPWNTPSVDWDLRGGHAKAMEVWARDRGKVLIAGHTHLPVFFQDQKPPSPPPPAGEDEAHDRAWKEWAAADQIRLEHQRPEPLDSPCYFNTGCCAFGDGDITGIEIEGGEIRLVRWPCVEKTDRQPLASMELEQVFALTAPL
jgi:hypothetical protein